MPRKQNGFGKATTLAFKRAKPVHKGKAVGAAGYYPSNRQYGSSVHRSVIEKYDLDSDWIKWRKGIPHPCDRPTIAELRPRPISL